MLIHGGYNRDVGPLWDTFMFDVTTLSWTKIVTEDNISNSIAHYPESDNGHSDVTDENEPLENNTSEIRRCDNTSKAGRWGLTRKKPFPGPRTGHAVGVVGLRMYIHGGYDGYGNLSDQLIALDTATVKAPKIVLDGEHLEEHTVKYCSSDSDLDSQGSDLDSVESDSEGDSDSIASITKLHNETKRSDEGSSAASNTKNRTSFPKLSLPIRKSFQWFKSKNGEPFVADKLAKDISVFRPTIDDMKCVIGVSCSLLLGNDPIGPVTFIQSEGEVTPDPMMRATAKMLIIRQEADFTRASIRLSNGREEKGVTIRLARTYIRIKVDDEVRVKEPYHVCFAVCIRPEPNELILQIKEDLRFHVVLRTMQDRDLMTLVARSFWTLEMQVVI